MSCVVRKSVFGFSDQVQLKPGCTASEDGYGLEIWDLESRGSAFYVAIKGMLIRKAVSTKLICSFVFAYICKKKLLFFS